MCLQKYFVTHKNVILQKATKRLRLIAFNVSPESHTQCQVNRLAQVPKLGHVWSLVKLMSTVFSHEYARVVTCVVSATPES